MQALPITKSKSKKKGRHFCRPFFNMRPKGRRLSYLLWQVLQTPEPVLPPTLLRNIPSEHCSPLLLHQALLMFWWVRALSSQVFSTSSQLRFLKWGSWQEEHSTLFLALPLKRSAMEAPSGMNPLTAQRFCIRLASKAVVAEVARSLVRSMDESTVLDGLGPATRPL